MVGDTGVAATGKREVPVCRLEQPPRAIVLASGTKADEGVVEELPNTMSRAAAAGHVELDRGILR